MARRVKLSQLDYFRAVGQLQHVTKAAQQLGISQPALSRAIAALETQIGVPLFEHRRRSIRLTENGEVLLAYVERAMATIDDGFDALRDLNEPGRGKIRIGFIRTLGYGFIPQLIRLFRLKYPDVQISLMENNSAKLEDEMKKGNLELIFVTQLRDSDACNAKKLASQAIQVVMPTNHRFANRDSVTLDDIKDEPFICFQEGHALRDLVNRIFASAGYTPNIEFECEDGSYLIGFVTAGLGITFLPPNHGQVEGVRSTKLSSPHAQRDIVLAWPNNRYVSQSALAFLEFSRSVVLPDMTLDPAHAGSCRT